MADPASDPALEGGWTKFTGYLGPVADEAGFYLAETDKEIGLFHYTGSVGSDIAKRGHATIGRVSKSRGNREALVKTLLSLVKGIPLTE
ncbi:MAG: hypothetical protein HY330_03270 [Chloroflexi bacterium]|nr:hypothetical protein [Chloroflexota bacterium]